LDLCDGNAIDAPHIGSMTNLIIGLCFGVAAAIALVIMWRMTARLEEERPSQDHRPTSEDTLNRVGPGVKPDGG
jgi:hypothetical protein